MEQINICSIEPDFIICYILLDLEFELMTMVTRFTLTNTYIY